MAGRFGVVGLTATIAHLAVLWCLLAQDSAPPLVANTLAFLTAFSLSLLGNYFWTFGAAGSLGQALRRFTAISAAGFLANEGMLATLLDSGKLSPLAAGFISVAVIPPITYLASRAWGFKAGAETSGP